MTVGTHDGTRRRGAMALAVIVTCLSAGPALGQSDSDATPERSRQWQFVVAPLYIWAVGIEGSSGIGPVNASLDISFKDALSNLDGTFTIQAEARRGKLGLYTNYYHVDLQPEFDVSLPGPFLGPLTVDVGVKNNIWENAVLYRVRDAAPSVDVYGGFRINTVNLKVSPLLPTTIRQRWVDGFGGVRLAYRFGANKRWRALGQADVGAGGSDLAWSSTLLLGYRVKDWLSLEAGYKWYDVDYETGSGINRFEYDVRYQGPIFGLAFRF